MVSFEDSVPDPSLTSNVTLGIGVNLPRLCFFVSKIEIIEPSSQGCGEEQMTRYVCVQPSPQFLAPNKCRNGGIHFPWANRHLSGRSEEGSLIYPLDPKFYALEFILHFHGILISYCFPIEGLIYAHLLWAMGRARPWVTRRAWLLLAILTGEMRLSGGGVRVPVVC